MTSFTKMSNRNPMKQFFITFPKSTIDKNQLRDELLKFDPEYYKVCEEKHKDGSPHLHAVIKFKNKFSKAHILKKFKEKYPDDYKRIDVEPVRSIKQAINYLSKEDPHPLESGTYQETRNPQQNWREKFAKDLGFQSVDDLVNQRKEEIHRIQEFRDKILQKELDYIDYDIPEMDYETKKSYNKIFSEFQFSKDDITKISKHFEIKY